jgi:hypothetical protein
MAKFVPFFLLVAAEERKRIKYRIKIALTYAKYRQYPKFLTLKKEKQFHVKYGGGLWLKSLIDEF